MKDKITYKCTENDNEIIIYCQDGLIDELHFGTVGCKSCGYTVIGFYDLLLALNKATQKANVVKKKSEKIFKVSQIRDLLNQVYNEKMTFSRMVEILNEQANES